MIDALETGRPVDPALLQRIQDERQPEIDAIQAGQTRAGRMVLKPLPVLHVMFTVLRVVMKVMGKRMQGGPAQRVEPRYLTPVA